MSASFRSILQQVTQEKLEELKRQKNLMSNHFEPVLNITEDKTIRSSPKEILQLLYQAVKNSPVQDTINEVLIENLKYVLQNSTGDPSISNQLISAWIQRLKQEIQYALRKCEYSYLYGSLLSEWLEIEEKKLRKAAATPEPGTQMEVDEPKAPEAKDVTLQKLKALMFTKPTTAEFNPEEFRNFLAKEMFDFSQNVDSEKTLEEIIKETKDFFKIENYYVSSHDVECCIKGLSSDDLLSPEKKAALKELSANQEALDEVAGLLTNRLKNLKRWEWPLNISEEPADIRRGLAGEYKAFLNEDIITALFLQYVGVEWAAYFKRQFRRIYDSRIWKKVDSNHYSIEGKRKQFYEKAFLSALPNSVQDQENKQQEEYARVEADEVQVCNFAAPAMAMRSMDSTALFGAGGPPQQAPQRMMRSVQHKMKKAVQILPIDTEIDFKQAFLHLLCTEIKLNQVIRPENPLLVVQADLETFGPSIIHEAVLIVMEYFGVSKDWLEFFQKFLQPNIKLDSNDRAAKVQRGVPSSHVLSSLFGETLLFLMDFLINQKCNGMRLHRISDELWFWNHELDHVKQAWGSIQSYGKMVGLKVNESRSGSVAVLSEQALEKQGPDAQNKVFCGPSPLPQRNIHWGYLELYSSGFFKIDKKAIEKFLKEMKVLLDKSECVLEWINIFNKYSAFFIRNFGKSAIASGKQHLDQIIEALRKIYSGTFGTSNCDPVENLRKRYPQLAESNVVDAWAYWPLERGGLGLINPFIGIMALRETFSELLSTEEHYFKKLPLEDKRIWEELKKEHEKIYGPIGDETGNQNGSIQPLPVGTIRPGGHHPMPPVRPKFPTWEEYIGKRETELSHWAEKYFRLLERPGPKYPPVSDLYTTLDEKQENEIDRNYMLWLFSYYETQLLLHFGNVTFINSKLLPMSMIANIQKSKVQHN